jgi:hypothetical protein
LNDRCSIDASKVFPLSGAVLTHDVMGFISSSCVKFNDLLITKRRSIFAAKRELKRARACVGWKTIACQFIGMSSFRPAARQSTRAVCQHAFAPKFI